MFGKLGSLVKAKREEKKGRKKNTLPEKAPHRTPTNRRDEGTVTPKSTAAGQNQRAQQRCLDPVTVVIQLAIAFTSLKNVVSRPIPHYMPTIIKPVTPTTRGS